MGSWVREICSTDLSDQRNVRTPYVAFAEKIDVRVKKDLEDFKDGAYMVDIIKVIW